MKRFERLKLRFFSFCNSASTKQYTKKASESYKKMWVWQFRFPLKRLQLAEMLFSCGFLFVLLLRRAPHTVRSASPSQEGSLSLEEQEKRWDEFNIFWGKNKRKQKDYISITMICFAGRRQQAVFWRGLRSRNAPMCSLLPRNMSMFVLLYF